MKGISEGDRVRTLSGLHPIQLTPCFQGKAGTATSVDSRRIGIKFDTPVKLDFTWFGQKGVEFMTASVEREFVRREEE